jgi:hypothetical protein
MWPVPLDASVRRPQFPRKEQDSPQTRQSKAGHCLDITFGQQLRPQGGAPVPSIPSGDGHATRCKVVEHVL